MVALTAGGADSSLYLHAKWRRAKPLAAARDAALTAAAFDAGAVTETTTGEALLGTAAGEIVAFSCDERDKRERGGATLYTLRAPGGARAPVTGLHIGRGAGGRRVVLAATAERLHVFAAPAGVGARGAPAGLAALVACYTPDGADLTNAWWPAGVGKDGATPPGVEGAGALAVTPAPGRGEAVTWLSSAGLATALLPSAAPESDPVPGREHELLAERAVALPPPGALGPAAHPRALAATAHHALVVDGGRIIALGRVGGGLVQALAPGAALRGAAATAAPPPLLPRRGLAADASTGAVYAVVGDGLLEIAATNEARDVWRVLAARGDFAAAARAAPDRAARDAVALAHADAMFAAGDLEAAAALHGRTVAEDAPFEATALRYVDAGDDAALATLLSSRLAALPPSYRAQAAALAAWLLEVRLDAVNRAALSRAGGGGGSADAAAADAADAAVADAADAALAATLAKHADALDAGVAVGLLAGYGRSADLLAYARARGDAEAVLEHLVAARDARGALAALRAAAGAADLAPRFAPALFHAAPDAAVDAWLDADPPLDPDALLPALARARVAGAPQVERAAALRFCRAVADAGRGGAALHNLAIGLLAQEAGERIQEEGRGEAGGAAAAADASTSPPPDPESDLLAYLAAARTPSGAPRYDPALALADAATARCRRGAVALLLDARAPDDALDAALAFDPALAASVALAPGADADTRRRLALAVVRHTVASAPAGAPPAATVDAVDAFLRSDAGACLRLEDVLPLFPGATAVGAFKAAVVRTLDGADARAESLRASAAAAAAAADAARADLAALGGRSGAVGAGEPCAACGRPVGGPPPACAGPAGGGLAPVYLFPTGAAYHGACCAAAAAAALPAAAAAALRARAAAVAAGAAPPAAIASLDADLSAEDPACGEAAVRSLDVPLVDPAADAADAAAWAVSAVAG